MVELIMCECVGTKGAREAATRKDLGELHAGGNKSCWSKESIRTREDPVV